ncbi:3-ketoacyl-CoA thiolase 5, peroxisomal-like [Aristolochia californica]|uniref:3-ketoacyl-CoA thiolase 5, peroxisomal-like n=1 Tax=Aristolochia californica TaxID=171875 RepID=UPI0035D8F025
MVESSSFNVEEENVCCNGKKDKMHECVSGHDTVELHGENVVLTAVYKIVLPDSQDNSVVVAVQKPILKTVAVQNIVLTTLVVQTTMLKIEMGGAEKFFHSIALGRLQLAEAMNAKFPSAATTIHQRALIALRESSQQNYNNVASTNFRGDRGFLEDIVYTLCMQNDETESVLSLKAAVARGFTRQEQNQAAVFSHKKTAAATTAVATTVIDTKYLEEKNVVIFVKKNVAEQKALPILGVSRNLVVVGVDPFVMGIGPPVAISAMGKALYEGTTPAFYLGKNSFYLGEVGNGAKRKLVVNMIMGSMMNALSKNGAHS